MIVVKNINNNVSLCLDSKNNEVIVFGKGVGFSKPPCEVPLEKIDKTFYNISEQQIKMIDQVSSEVLEVSSMIVDYANQKLGNQFQSNVVFTLADHIEFACKRQAENIQITLPIMHEIEQTYQEEIYVAQRAVEMINKKLNVNLPMAEAAAIALHLVNYEAQQQAPKEQHDGNLVNSCIDKISEKLHITIDKKSFNYYRFVTHLYYLLKRVGRNEMIQSQNQQIFYALKQEFPDVYECAMEIADLIQKEFDKQLSEEEILYLILHINRLCSREDCDH
jgi:beta-glucoside operon transcriptional antiterminator